MLLQIFQTGREQSHWFNRPLELDWPPHPAAPIQIVCEDEGLRSVSFSGRLQIGHSPDGKQLCVNVLLNHPMPPTPCASAAATSGAARSAMPGPAQSSLCIPLPREAVSRLRPKPGHPGELELRLEGVRIDFATQQSRATAIRSARLAQRAASGLSFAAQPFPDGTAFRDRREGAGLLHALGQ